MTWKKAADGRMYSDGEFFPAAYVAPAIYAASPTFTAFDTQGHSELIAELRTHAFLTTALTGANNDINFIARTPGSGGTSITVAIVVSGNNTALSVSVTASAITINSATSGAGAATSTAAEVIAAVKAKQSAHDLVIVENAASNDGTGAVVALSATNLIDFPGSSPTFDVKLQTAVDGSTFADTVSFTQVTAIGATETKNFPDLGRTVKWVATLGGTATPKACVSIYPYVR